MLRNPTLCLFALSLLMAVVAKSAAGQTFTSLVSFDGTDGSNPDLMSLVQGFDGNLYGTTPSGGANGKGTVFKMSRSRTLTTLYNFCSQINCADGSSPYQGLLQATDGNLYGTAFEGGENGFGTVFRITPAGTLTTLHSFTGTDGANPASGLLQATDGNFYGTAFKGGVSNYGTIFRITSGGTLTTLHNFNGTDGGNPTSGLVQATDGNFYGTASQGGANLFGTVFKITPAGTLTTLYNFCSQSKCSDGASPIAALVQAIDGYFYGTTYEGGAKTYYGVVFRISASGTLTTLHSFNGHDGTGPYAGLIQATDGNFYGATYSNGGTIFEVTPSGKLTTLHTFTGADGDEPFGRLVQHTDGSFYGTTYYGGISGYGTVFNLSVGLAPFVETLPASGKVGTTVYILGTNLTGATSVSFNGTAATFAVISATEIIATVPAGATTGFVTVNGPSGTIKSDKTFEVAP